MRLLPEDGVPAAFNPSSLDEKKPNRLINEKSPYLLHHAFNPVDWFPWGEEAFIKARKEDKPVFLSIGYSSCYWCHVMEREVFENRSIADLMNLMVVSVKVDREERPDIDRVYMMALQSMTGNGGWPMSIFMTPDRKPFFAATYIPQDNRSGRLGFKELLHSIHRTWITKRSSVLDFSIKIHNQLIESSVPPSLDVPITEQMLTDCFKQFENSFDNTYGGFGNAPKFPRPSILNFLFRYYHRTGNCTARDMALTTLQKMAEGGIYDQLGGGFHRYSTDERWHIPHFEKMLYDQAVLVLSYLEAFQISRDPLFAQVAREVLTYVEHVQKSPEGGFYSAEDAESAVSFLHPDEKKEGAFYLWRKDAIDRVLNAKEAKILEFIYGIEEHGNISSELGQEFFKENILKLTHSLEETAYMFHENIENILVCFENAKQKIFNERNKRPRPLLDDKILLSWNGLMISAFARASHVLGNKPYVDEASNAARFLLSTLMDGETGRLLRRYRDRESKFEAHLSDYAFFIQGLLDLYEATVETEWLQTAIRLTEEQNRLFYDTEKGGFFDNSGTDPTILFRTKDPWDHAEPSGNSIAILNLQRLSHMVGNSRFHDLALKSMKSFGNFIEDIPQALPQYLVAVDFNLSQPLHIVMTGEKKHPVLRDMLREIHSRFLPNKIIVHLDDAQFQDAASRHIAFLKTLDNKNTQPCVYICDNYTCELPATDTRTLARILGRKLHS
jgi:uncharacterized protein